MPFVSVRSKSFVKEDPVSSWQAGRQAGWLVRSGRWPGLCVCSVGVVWPDRDGWAKPRRAPIAAPNKKPRPARVPASLSASQARARASAAEAARVWCPSLSPLLSLRSLEKIEKGRDTWDSPLLGSVSIHPFHPIPSHPLLHLVLVPIDSLCRFRLIWSAAINRHDIG